MRSRMRSRHYFRQVLLLTIIILFVLCLLFSVILYVTTSKATTEMVARTELSRTGDLLRQADIYLNQFVSKNTVFNGLNIPYEQISITSNYWTRTIFRRMILSHTNSDIYVSNIDIVSNGLSTYPSTVTHDRILGKYSVFTIYTDEGTSWPYYFDLSSANRAGVEVVTLTISGYHLSKQLFSFQDDSRMDYLLLPDGTILLTNIKSAFFKNIEDVYPGLFADEKLRDGELRSYGGYFASISQMDKYGFHILSLVKKDVYTPQFTTMILQILIAVFFLLLVAAFLSWILSTLFYRPVNDMVNLLKTYIPEELQDYENEIAFINQNVSKYVAKGKELEVALPLAIARMQEAQAASMQHQINSHFLFNTLENIKAISVSELGMDNEIEISIMMLNNLIHESILQKNAIVTLSHEIYLAKSYLQLMQIRYPGVQVSWSVDESLNDCSVFKFSLQPILENCFTHAFRSRTGREPQIEITVLRSDNDFIIRVHDNGRGIDAKTLAWLRQHLETPSEVENAKSVGMRNIQKRITAVFGQSYGVTVSCGQVGTTVDIRYPVTEALGPGPGRM